MLLNRSVLLLSVSLTFANEVYAQECGPVGADVIKGDSFLVNDRSGQLAWLKDGENSANHYILSGCNILYVRKAQTLYFKLNNAFRARGADGKASFVAVQIARVQETDQAVLDITIERNDDWARNNIPQDGFGPVAVKDTSPQNFMQLHSKLPFKDDSLRFKTFWWHATPNGGAFSSSDNPAWWVWDLPLLNAIPKRTLLSNRLYKFDFNPDGNTGIPFFVRTNGTEQMIIRIFSPIWPDTIWTFTLKLKV